VGALAGSALGYAGAKELTNIGDVYFGGGKQRPPLDEVKRVGGNLAEGATYEALGSVLSKPISYGLRKGGELIGRIADMNPVNKIAAILRDTVGTDKNAVVDAMRRSTSGLLPAQEVAGMKLPEFQAAAELAVARAPKPFGRVIDRQQAASLAELESLAGGSTQTQTRAAQEAQKKVVNAALIPERDIELRAANLAGELKPGLDAKAAGMEDAAAASVDKVRRFMPAGERAAERAAATTPVPWMPRLGSAGKYTYMGEQAGVADKWASRAADASLDLGQGARFARSAAESLAAHGLQPLESKPIVAGIQALTKNVNHAGNEPLLSSINEVAKQIEKWTGGGGVIAAFALDAIRKNAVNAAVQKNLQGADPKVQQKAAAILLNDIKPIIDQAIEKAGGTRYKAYLDAYAAEMQELAKTKLAGKALNLFKTSPDRFVRLVNGEVPKDVEKILGPGHYDISTELHPDAFDVLKRAAVTIERSKEMAAQANQGRAALSAILTQHESAFRLPNLLNRGVSTANVAIAGLEKRIGTKTMEKLAEVFQSNRKVADMLERLPAAERTALRRALADTKAWLPPALKGAFAGADVLSTAEE